MSAHDLSSLRAEPNSLADHYRAFRVRERLLLTGHSHQAWPDVAKRGLDACFDDAAERVDDKWERAFAQAERVREGIAALLGGLGGSIALGASTHDLIVRWLSALPLRDKPRIVTSDAEFHSMRRQLTRLEEEGIELTRVSAEPVDTLAERLLEGARAGQARTACVMVSSVLFTSGQIVPHLGDVGPTLAALRIPLLIDAYHHLGVVPFSPQGLEQATIVGGGYKYLQLGEGNCFMRLPEGDAPRPVITGWFAEFPWLDQVARPSPTPYDTGALRMSGSTYDPASHYRAAAVFAFFREQGLDVGLLRRVSQHQTTLLRAGIRALDVAPDVLRLQHDEEPSRFGGFVSAECGRAQELVEALRTRGVMVDRRGSIVRFGPAPYLSDAQLEAALGALAEALGR